MAASGERNTTLYGTGKRGTIAFVSAQCTEYRRLSHKNAGLNANSVRPGFHTDCSLHTSLDTI